MVLKGEEGSDSEESIFFSSVLRSVRPCTGEALLEVEPTSICMCSSSCVLLFSSCDVVKSIGIVLRGLKWLVIVFLLAVLDVVSLLLDRSGGWLGCLPLVEEFCDWAVGCCWGCG